MTHAREGRLGKHAQSRDASTISDARSVLATIAGVVHHYPPPSPCLRQGAGRGETMQDMQHTANRRGGTPLPYLAFYNVERNRQGTVQETTRSDVHTRAQRENHRTVPRSDRTTYKHEGGRAGCAWTLLRRTTNTLGFRLINDTPASTIQA